MRVTRALAKVQATFLESVGVPEEEGTSKRSEKQTDMPRGKDKGNPKETEMETQKAEQVTGGEEVGETMTDLTEGGAMEGGQGQKQTGAGQKRKGAGEASKEAKKTKAGKETGEKRGEAEESTLGSGAFYGDTEETKKLREEAKAKQTKETKEKIATGMEKATLLNVKLSERAYPEEWLKTELKSFPVPLAMCVNGNDIGKAGVIHPEKSAETGQPKTIRITERVTATHQVENAKRLYREGFNPKAGTFVGVVKPFGQDVKWTQAELDAMDDVDKEEIRIFEQRVKEMCESKDAQEKAEGEWLRDNVVGRKIFLIDGNSRLTGFRQARAEQTAAERRPILVPTEFMKLTPKNMHKLNMLSVRVNDVNVELNSRKSVPQEVCQVYAIHDYTDEEMADVFGPEVRAMLESKFPKLKVAAQGATKATGMKWSSYAYAACMKPLIMDTIVDAALKEGVDAAALQKKLTDMCKNVLKRVHGARLDRRSFWEPVMRRWEASPDGARIVPDVETLSIMKNKKLPEEWERTIIWVLELPETEFGEYVGGKKTQIRMTELLKWYAAMFSISDAAVQLMERYGFYKKAEEGTSARKAGVRPVADRKFVKYDRFMSPYDVARAFGWMKVPLEKKPFFWVAKEYSKLTEENLRTWAWRFIMWYFRIVNSGGDVKPEHLPALVAKSLPERALAHLASVPQSAVELRAVLARVLGWPEREGFEDKSRVFSEKAYAVYGREETERLAEFGTTRFLESQAGCRMEVDCGGGLPPVQVWTGVEPMGWPQKLALPQVTLLGGEAVKKAVPGPRSIVEHRNKELLELQSDKMLALICPQSSKAGVTDTLVPLSKIEAAMGWLMEVGKEEEKWTVSSEPVPLVLYVARRSMFDIEEDGQIKQLTYSSGYASKGELRNGLKLLKECLAWSSSVGVVILPSKTPLSFVTDSGLQVLMQRYVGIKEDMSTGVVRMTPGFEREGHGYSVLFVVNGDDNPKVEGSKALRHIIEQGYMHGEMGGEYYTMQRGNIFSPKFYELILDGLVKEKTPSWPVVVIGEENGAASCYLEDLGARVVAVMTRRLDKWLGWYGELTSTPLDVPFSERRDELGGLWEGSEGQEGEKKRIEAHEAAQVQRKKDEEAARAKEAKEAEKMRKAEERKAEGGKKRKGKKKEEKYEEDEGSSEEEGLVGKEGEEASVHTSEAKSSDDEEMEEGGEGEVEGEEGGEGEVEGQAGKEGAFMVFPQ